jgi:hypothetical protein
MFAAPAPGHLRPMANGWYQEVSFEFSTRCARQGMDDHLAATVFGHVAVGSLCQSKAGSFSYRS